MFIAIVYNSLYMIIFYTQTEASANDLSQLLMPVLYAKEAVLNERQRFDTQTWVFCRRFVAFSTRAVHAKETVLNERQRFDTQTWVFCRRFVAFSTLVVHAKEAASSERQLFDTRTGFSAVNSLPFPWRSGCILKKRTFFTKGNVLIPGQKFSTIILLPF